ncbi:MULTISPECIES: restriction endonuclease subunit S [unclassified Pseudoalteromonas]|uniref:restriction endonuclease subunit S n=1 Tax=unclassified Pseudoalteromonas TaxID=194690 RepID=UPI0005A92AF0|nr:MULTISPECIES: restriction endonuclease subunit S [unclassified Pseudoalteromonas]
MLGNNIENIPEGWTVANIEDIADIKTGSGDTQDKEEGGKYPFYVRSNTIERVNNYTFDGEGVLTSGDGVGVGKIYHYVNGKIHYHQRVYNIHNFKKNVLGRYFYEYFRHNFYSRVMRMSAKGSVDSVRLDMIAKMSVLIPPLVEQEKVADILSSVNQKIDLIHSKIEHTQKLRKGLIQKLFSIGVGIKDINGNWHSHTEFKDTKIGKLPKKWRCIRLGDLTEINYGKSPKGLDSGVGENPIFGTGGIVGFSNQSVCKTSSVILGRKGTIDKVQYSDKPFWCIDTTFYTSNHKHCSAKWVYLYLSKLDLRKLNEATGVPSLSRKNLENILIPIPSESEEAFIIDLFEQLDKSSRLLEEQFKEIQNLKKGLMQKLLTGKWRVNLDKVTEKQVALKA